MYATDFYEILETLKTNSDLKVRVLAEIDAGNIIGKSTEEDSRKSDFKTILKELVNGQILTLEDSYSEVERRIPRATSRHASDNRTFADGWGERLVRVQLSRFYNQAVLKHLRDEGEEVVFVPHSGHEESTSRCTQELANKEHSIELLLTRLENAYERGDYSDRGAKVPNHPHCTHVVMPKIT